MLLKKKIIGIVSDHAGFELKEFLRESLINSEFEILDMGTFSDKSTDYPDYAHMLGAEVNSGRLSSGIAICGSGQGMSITLNKYPNVRAALCWNGDIAQLARLHNDANILVLPGRFVRHEAALEMVQIFMKTDFEGGRHQARVDKIKIKI